MKSDVISTMFKKDTGFGQIIDESVSSQADHTALVADGVRLTYGEFGEKVKRLAAALERDGVKPGEPIAIVSRNCAEYLIIEFALFKIGAVSVKINWRFSSTEIQNLLELNNVRLAFVRCECSTLAEEILEKNRGRDIRFISMRPNERGVSPFDEYMQNAPAAEDFHEKPIDLDWPLLRIHTSGTTGKPKCVVHTHRDFMDEIKSSIAAIGYSSGWIYQMISQMFHVSCIGAYMVLATGGTLILLSRFDKKTYLESIEHEKVTAIGVLPVVLKSLLDDPLLNDYDIGSIRHINYSTCPMPPALLKEAISRFGDDCNFCQSYGMTEMASIVTVLSPEDHRIDGGIHLGSVGRPIPGVKVCIEDENGNVCAPGCIGEILLKGPGQMRGYYNCPEEVNESVLKGGWYHSKDMGYLDENGYLYVCGRKDDLIISGGENIYPKEIVDVMMRLTDDVEEVAVYGVPDPVWGEHVKASVVLRKESTMTVDELKAYCRKNIAHYKAPKEIELLSSLPKSATGKVNISKLKAH